MSDPIVRTVRAVVAPVTRTRAFRWLAPRYMPVVERAIAAVTGSTIQLGGLLVPTLVLRARSTPRGATNCSLTLTRELSAGHATGRE